MKQSRGAETHDRARAVHFQEESVASVTSTTGTTSAKKGVWSRLRTALSKRKAASSTVTQQAEADPQGSPGPSERTPPVNEAVELRAQDAVGRIPMANGTLPLKSFTTFDDLWSRISDSSIPSDSEGLMRDWSGRLKEGEWIGGGGFGDVYKGIWENLSNIDPTSVPVVVVKVIQQRALWKHEKRSVKLFNREIKICLQLQHPNIVSFIGVVFGFGHSQKSELPALISLYMPNGTVKAYLKNQDEPPPLHMFLEIAKGIKYLHTFNPLIVHGDIKAENILVDDRGRLRVTDFGLSRMIVDQADWATTALEAPGTDRWMAPELLEGTQTTVTKESDIYALGMTFLEMRTRDLPFSQYKNRGAVFTAVLVRKEKPLRPPGLEDSIWDLLVSTWAYAPSERLNIMQLVSSLEPYGHPFSSYPNFTPDPRYLTVGWTDWTGYLTAGEPISAGGFSEVHEGKWTDIAIEKRLSVRHVVIEISRRRGGPAPKADFKVSKRMLREVDAYSRIHHKNIVSFLGIIYLRPDSEISLVFEFAEKGTLLKYLEDNPKANRYSYLKDLAHAIDYIHSLTPGVIHGSITGRQLLVKGDGTLLLGGFGLSKVTEDVSSWETSVSNAGGDVRWMAPEVLSGVVAHASAATDTYAFGMTIVEILTGRVPFFNLRRESEVIVVVVVRNERPTRPHGMPNWLWSIACRCWAEDPDSRPRMSEVVRLFDASLAEWQDG